MHVSHFSLGPLGTNAYLLENKGKALCIDPGGDPQPILQALGNTELTHILITQSYFGVSPGSSSVFFSE